VGRRNKRGGISRDDALDMVVVFLRSIDLVVAFNYA
jgi:hypothetical protein